MTGGVVTFKNLLTGSFHFPKSRLLSSRPSVHRVFTATQYVWSISSNNSSLHSLIPPVTNRNAHLHPTDTSTDAKRYRMSVNVILTCVDKHATNTITPSWKMVILDIFLISVFSLYLKKKDAVLWPDGWRRPRMVLLSNVQRAGDGRFYTSCGSRVT